MKRHHRRRALALADIRRLLDADPALAEQHRHWSALGYDLSGRIVRRRAGRLARIVWRNAGAALSEVRVIVMVSP